MTATGVHNIEMMDKLRDAAEPPHTFAALKEEQLNMKQVTLS